LLDVKAIVAQGLQAQTIDAKNATINNLTVNNANVTGKIMATSGNIGKWNISSGGGLVNSDGCAYIAACYNNSEFIVQNSKSRMPYLNVEGNLVEVDYDFVRIEDNNNIGNALHVIGSSRFNGRTQFDSGIVTSVTAITSDYNMTDGDFIIICNNNNDCSVYLPDNTLTGDIKIIRKQSNGNIWVKRADGGNIQDCNEGSGGSIKDTIKMENAQLGFFFFNGSVWVYNVMN
jgi:hypothetical protein